MAFNSICFFVSFSSLFRCCCCVFPSELVDFTISLCFHVIIIYIFHFSIYHSSKIAIIQWWKWKSQMVDNIIIFPFCIFLLFFFLTFCIFRCCVLVVLFAMNFFICCEHMYNSITRSCITFLWWKSLFPLVFLIPNIWITVSNSKERMFIEYIIYVHKAHCHIDFYHIHKSWKSRKSIEISTT